MNHIQEVDGFVQTLRGEWKTKSMHGTMYVSLSVLTCELQLNFIEILTEAELLINSINASTDVALLKHPKRCSCSSQRWSIMDEENDTDHWLHASLGNKRRP